MANYGSSLNSHFTLIEVYFWFDLGFSASTIRKAKFRVEKTVVKFLLIYLDSSWWTQTRAHHGEPKTTECTEHGQVVAQGYPLLCIFIIMYSCLYLHFSWRSRNSGRGISRVLPSLLLQHQPWDATEELISDRILFYAFLIDLFLGFLTLCCIHTVQYCNCSKVNPVWK